MNNIQRLAMEIKGIELEQNELIIYLLESGLDAHDEYIATSNSNKRKVYMTALSVLESLANNPTLMRTVKVDDMTVSEFHENLLARISQLENTVRKMPVDDTNTNTFLLYV